VIALRAPLRRWLGARAAYRLWLLPVLAAAAVMLPARVVTVQAPTLRPSEPPPAASAEPMSARTTAAPAPQLEPSPVAASPRDTWPLLLALWLAGAVAFAGRLAARQRRFLQLAARGEAGPAAVGVIRPRIVLPADFATRFTAAEQQAVLAHEEAHIAAGHPRINGLIAMVQGLCWFNPLVHVGARLMRMDQELACDAVVVARLPAGRRLYAQTLLKTQLAATPLPLGCYWPAGADHPLTMRVEMLNRAAPSRTRRLIATALIATLAAGSGLAAWAAQPPQTRYLFAAETTSPSDTDQAWLMMRSLEVDIANQERFLDRAPDPAAMRAFIAQERAKVADIKRRIAGKPVSEALRLSDRGALEAQAAEWAHVARWDRPGVAGRWRASAYCPEESGCRLESITPAAPQAYSAWALRFANLVNTTGPRHLPQGEGLLVKFDMTPETISLPVSESLLRSTPTQPPVVEVFLGFGPRGLPISVVPPPKTTAATRPAPASPERDLFAARARLQNARAGPGDIAQASEKSSALSSGDWLQAARLGAGAADIVRALQGKGQYRELDPEQAVVTIDPDNTVEALPLKPLPSLEGAGAETRTAALAGTGFEFSRRDSIVLYPAYAGRSMSQSGR
jgi:beta-lactamase regulating signal transducer with metallopeptidase domain